MAVLDKVWNKKYIWITIAAVNSQMFLVSNVVGWTSAAIPKKVDIWGPDVQDELGNFLMFGILMGSAISYFMLQYLGRKTSLIINEFFLLISWILVLFPEKTPVLYIGRFFGGIAASSVALVLPVYEAETFHPKDRQISGGFMCMYVALGLMLEYSLGPFVSYNTIVYLNILPIVLFLISFPCLGQETPFYLIKIGNVTKADQVMNSFWAHDSTQQEIDDETENIKVTVSEAKQMSTLKIFKSMFLDKGNLKAVIISLILITFYSVCGAFQMSMFMEPILKKANVKQISDSASSAVVGSVKPIGAMLSLPLINFLGVKKSLMFTLVGTTISLASLGTYFYFQSIGSNVINSIYWLPLTSFSVYFLCGLMGASVLPYIIRGEMLPNHLRGPGGATTDLICSFFSVGANFYYNAFEDQIYITFWTFAGLTLAQILFIATCIPETKDKTLHEIQVSLKS